MLPYTEGFLRNGNTPLHLGRYVFEFGSLHHHRREETAGNHY